MLDRENWVTNNVPSSGLMGTASASPRTTVHTAATLVQYSVVWRGCRLCWPGATRPIECGVRHRRSNIRPRSCYRPCYRLITDLDDSYSRNNRTCANYELRPSDTTVSCVRRLISGTRARPGNGRCARQRCGTPVQYQGYSLSEPRDVT